MKKNKLLAVIAFAAALAAPLTTHATTGDIVDIRAVDTDEFSFGVRNAGSPTLCTADHPLVAGDNLYIRVRMLVRNWQMAAHNAEAPLTWTFQPGALGQSSLYMPKLGLWIGDRAAYAVYSDYGFYSWQKSGTLVTDNAGNVDPSWTFPPWQYYTDLYFVYKVQAGDLGLPIKLMNSSGTGPASGIDTNTGYYLLNCSDDGTDHNVLKNANGDVARFWYGPETLDPDWPEGIPEDVPLRNFDLSAESAYAKTINFDGVNAAGDPYVDGDVWRNVYLGMSASSATAPRLVVGGGASTEATTVYIWSGDESVVVPAASGANEVTTVDGKKVLKVLIPAGAEDATFLLRGVDGAAVGATATVYLSPVQSAVYKPTGELADVTVSRTVKIIKAPIDFDNVNATGGVYVDGDVWRYVYPGLKDAPATPPTLLFKENASSTATVVYVWPEDGDVVVPVASSAGEVITVGGKKVLKVSVPAGAEQIEFSMMGAADAAIGATTTLYLSPMLSAVSKTPAELATIAVSRPVEVVKAPQPTVRMFLNGTSDTTATVLADSEYKVKKATLVFQVSPTCTEDVTVDLSATVEGGSSLTALYNGNFLRICDSETFDMSGTPLQVTIPANTPVVTKYVYILGASEGTENGITFKHTMAAGSPAGVVATGTCMLYVNRGGEDHPIEVTAFSPANTQPLVVDSGSARTFNLKIEDTYRSLNDTATGYTFYLIDVDTLDELQTKSGAKANFSRKQISWSITFDQSYNGRTVAIYALSPDGLTMTREVQYSIKVNEGRRVKVEPAEEGVFTAGESQAAYNLSLSLNQAASGDSPKFIFLEGATPADSALFTSSLTSIGATVAPGTTAPTSPTSVRFVDGGAGGTPVTINGFLSDAQTDPTDRTVGWTPGSITVIVTNEAPRAGMISIGGAPVMIAKGETLPDPISSDVPKTFSITAQDVDADLNATGDNAFLVRWSIDGREYVTEGNPNGILVTNIFYSAKEKAPVYVWLKDKDMDWQAEPDFYFYVNVKDKPGLTLSKNGEGIFSETDASVAQLYLRLSEAATSEIVVRLTVSDPGDEGFIRLRNVPGSVTNVYKEVDGEMVVDPNAYDVIFNAGVVNKTLIVADMDGTDGTLAGVDVNAKVITETKNADGVRWCDFYTSAEPMLVQVQNEPPQVIRPTEDEAAYTNMNASANTPYVITYACRDVPADMASNIVVDISVDGTSVFTTNVNSTAAYTYPVEFSGEGAHVVEVTFTDKDQMTSRRTLNFYVQPSKNLQLRAHGPAPAMATSGGYSMHYSLAAGLGAGRVFAGDNGPQKVWNFVHTYSFGITASSADAYAYGYKADDKFDDGSLRPTPDKGIDEYGDWQKGQVFGDGDGESKYYNYTRQHKWGKLGYDSFLYAWACNNSAATSTTGGDSQTSSTLIINAAEGGSIAIPLPDADDKESKSLPMQYWEAVFSREFLKSDNCGDINLDGVPDLALMRYGMDIFGPNGEIVKTEGEGDLTPLDGYNKDLDKEGAAAPDYLPSAATSVYGSLIPGLAGTWATQGAEFTAKLEIRGYHEGLNDAMAQLGFDAEPDRIYAEGFPAEEGGTRWLWTENCTISELEFYAWTEYAAANGYDWTDENAWQLWSPERPTSPVLDDTDDDGFDDGYEYYFWYKAHVGYFDYDSNGNRVHKRISGRRYDPKNPGEGTIITAEEIEKVFDPRVAYDPATADTRDTDNDGLPDLLEFEIGTNPIDFDTDGDGLADGWELMIAGLNPLLVQSANDALNDGERTYDGDAMAITSYKLEQAESPVPKHPEIAQFTTFAVRNADADGSWGKAQWYATKEAGFAIETNYWTVACFKLADGTPVISEWIPEITVDGRLAETIEASDAWLATTSTITEVDDSDPENPVETERDIFVAGWPIRLEAGTLVDLDSFPDDYEDAMFLYVAEELPADKFFSAWVYGRGTADANSGAVADSAAEYGCLALGAPKRVLQDRGICAMPSTDRDVALLHYLVYQQFGFDPRTAWSPKNPLAARWGKVVNGDVVEDVDMNRAGGYCAVPARTRAYTTYDEFLVYSFFLNNGCDMGGYVTTVANKAPELAKVWFAMTTNPQGPNEPGNITLDLPAADGSDAASEYYFGRDSENGADTDGDGVPDGWELYVMAGPKKKGKFVFAPPYAGFEPALAKKDHSMPKSYYSPFVDSAQKNDTNNPNYDDSANDGLNEFMEFESTDAMNYYAEVYGEATSTIVHAEEWKWLNKFFPTNPWSKDTDGDGLSDAAEKESFIYTCKDCDGPADDGKLLSIPGGGLNPCSVDTDNDGLPDPWEVQFKGRTPFPGDLPEILASNGDRAKDAENNAIGNYLQGLVDGMDGTVKDAFSYPVTSSGVSGSTNGLTFVTANGFKQVVNRDYDRDGLENWQEYQTGMMRCWRYDDPISPWIPIPSNAYFNEGFHPNYAMLKDMYGVEIADDDDFWTKTLVDKTSPIYNPGLITDVSSGAQYLSPVTNVWDSCYIDTKIGGGRHAAYYWFYNRVGDTKIDDLWSVVCLPIGINKAPTKYACCSPLDPDSDHDGMDDYYELFHGMNPLLGLSGVNLSSQGPCDLVCDAWGLPAREAWGGMLTMNHWQLNPWKQTRLNGYDFEVYPWLSGVVDADPDGDGLPNQTEALLPKLSAPELHSDPTPLWQTDSSYTNSLVCRFFRMPTRYDDVETQGETFLDGTTVRYFKDFEGWQPATDTKPSHFGAFAPDSWKLAAPTMANWMFSFEENEGYDSDHDGISDVAEKEGKYRKATDVLDADSPRRRQAMYFQGPERPSALQTMPQVVEAHPVQATSYPDEMTFRTYTVECWVRPESLDDSVIVERAISISTENPADEEYIRKNFQLGIKDGYWYTKFDPFTTRAADAVTAVSVTAADATKWTHLAATYDGTDLVLYVNGVAERTVRSGLLPTYGSFAVVVHRADAGSIAQTYWSDIEYELFAIVVGASVKAQADGGYGLALDMTQNKIGWSDYTGFYKGWVDEIRIWDGARTAAEIAGAMRTRFTAAMVEENRSNFYDKWSLGWRRDDKDENGNAYALPAELCYHWSFDSIFGAENESAVATSPHGFNDVRAVASRADGYEITWWSAVLGLYEGTIYNDPAWVPWIPNTVTHMPRFDGTTLDSFFWSDDFMGDAAGTYRFDRTAEPVSLWTQFNRNGTNSDSEYGTTGSRYSIVNLASAVGGSSQDKLFEFTGRHLNRSGDDLLPLGGAYARFCDNEVGLWDGQGASSNWEISGTDADGDGLPDWWEQYADENYRRAGMDPAEDIGWETVISYNGVEMTAGEAYLRDLARGSYMNEFGETVVGSGSYEQRADEDGSGIPDWWEEMYGIAGESGLDDHDNDGLPNYVEYLLSEVFKFEGVSFSPINPHSVDSYTLDYFYRVGSLYVGEIFTDHDLVDDEWEDKYQKLDDGSAIYASRFAYDASADVDEDGWSNRSEARYSKMVMPIVANAQNHYTAADGLLADYPIPTLALTLRYNGVRQATVKTAPIVVQVSRSGAAGNDSPDAEYYIGAVMEAEGATGQDSSQATAGSTSYTRTVGKWSDRHVRGTLTPGNISLNTLQFESCYDPSSVAYSWEERMVGFGASGYQDGWYEVNGAWTRIRRGTRSEYDAAKRKYGDANVILLSMTDGYGQFQGLSLRSDETGTIATWIHNNSGMVLGTINLKSGEFDIDLGVLKGGILVNASNETEFVSFEDLTYRIAYASSPSVGLPRKLYLGASDVGHVREGANDIIAFADLNNDGKLTSGEPYGIVQNVDVSWKGVSAEIELTDSSPVTPRFDVFAAGTMQVATTNIAEAAESSSGGGEETEVAEPVRVRVVRWKIDGKPIYDMAVAPLVVFDKVMDPRVAATITENDFVDGDTFDLDWDNFYSGVVQNPGVRSGNFRVVRADYLAIIGDGDVSWYSFESNKWLTASKQVITRYYGESRVMPQPVSPGSVSPASSAMGVVNTANPTFAWTIDAPDREGYTAFRIVVTNAAGTVYDSGIRHAPARDGEGVYRWAAPLYVGDMTTQGQVFANKSTYGWRVSMYNSKFRTDSYSSAAPFSMNVQTNGYSSGTANVGVRYFGPVASYAGKVVRVQAFASPDFTGMPVAAGYVADASALAKTGEEVAANSAVAGLPDGQYYLKAFIDSNNNGVCDEWESSGYLCARDGTSVDWLNPAAITVGPGAGISEVAEIYLEDADTDSDGLPDSWEYALYGSLTAKGIELVSETPAGEELVNASLVGALELRANAQVPAAGLATRVRSSLRNAGTLALALGVNTSGYDSFAAAISGSVSDKLAEDGVKISSLSFVDGKVSITVDVETESGSELTGPLASSVAPKSADLEVVAKVYWKQSLADSQWTLVAEKTFVAGSGETEIDAGAAVNGTSGFYKVEVEEKK